MILLIIYGFFNLYWVFFRTTNEYPHKIRRLLLGLISIPFGLFILYILFNHPSIHRGYIIYFIAVISIIIGAAGIFKGILVDVFSKKSRISNVFMGIFSILFSFISCIYSQEFFILNLIFHTIFLILNGIARSMLYLSEYDIPLLELRKATIFKFLLRIMNDPPYRIETLK